MTKQLLFYEKVTPITKQRHAAWAVDRSAGYGFAGAANSIPLMAVEFPSAASEYPIVFTKAEEAALPAVVLGVDNDQNLYLDADGHWNARYVPAFVRRYPFVFTLTHEGEKFTLCIDEAFAGCDSSGKTGERLFDDQGERTPFLDRMLDFTNNYQVEHRRTQELGKILLELDLLEPMQAQITLPSKEQRSLTGFFAVSRERLKKLDDAKLAQLVRSDALELIYAHLASIRNFERLLDRLRTRAGGANGAGAKQPAEAGA